MTRQEGRRIEEEKGFRCRISLIKDALMGMGMGGIAAAGYRKKKSGAKEGKEEASKVYECRFCSLKFCKSQALGGHMNRHRQERENETLNKARQLVFTNDLAPPGHGHLGYVSAGQPMPHMNDGELPFRPVCSTRLFPPAGNGYMYSSPPRMLSFHSAAPVSDYFMGHVMRNNGRSVGEGNNNYTCIGAPVGPGFGGGGTGGVRDMSLQNEEEGLSWGRR